MGNDVTWDNRNSAGIVLTEPQARSLTTTVVHLWDTLDQLEHLLDAPRPATGFSLLDADIAPQAVAGLREGIARLRQDVRELADLAGVRPAHQSAVRAFAALATGAWTVAVDAHPRKLRRYGEVDPSTSALGPVIDRLAAGFLALAQQVERATPASANGPASD